MIILCEYLMQLIIMIELSELEPDGVEAARWATVQPTRADGERP